MPDEPEIDGFDPDAAAGEQFGEVAVVPQQFATDLINNLVAGFEGEDLAADPDEQLFNAAFNELGELDEELVEGDRVDQAQAAARVPVYQPPEVAFEEAIAIAGPDGQQNDPGAARAAAWRPLFELPGYADPGRRGESIRTLGRGIFRNMPCFRRMEEECRVVGRDPLGEVQVMANIGGAGPTSPAQMDAMSVWIRQNGRIADSAQIVLPHMGHAYRPNIILAVTENDSFLMVEELVRNGAPSNSLFIYSWRGGRQVYLNNPEARIGLESVGGVAQARPALPAPVEQPVAARPQPAAAPAEVKAPVQAPDPRIPARIAGPSIAAQTRVNPISIIRNAGFQQIGTDAGPALAKDLPDGGQMMVVGSGRSLSLATAYVVRIIDGNGVETECFVAEGPQAVLDALSVKENPAPSP
jgi:hypothetical protein